MFNWIGNKLKYFSIVEPYLEKFKYVIDPMMGSANILIKLKDKHILGNDIIKLMSIILNRYNDFDKSVETMNRINDTYNKFFHKEDYYLFRKRWNEKYTSNNYPKTFLIETFFLLKMCSNSVVRFNSRDEFNSGFRGLGNKSTFFSDKNFVDFEKQLNSIHIDSSKCRFYNKDVIDFLKDFDWDFENSIFIFDPPYLMTGGMYENTGMYSKIYTEEKEKQILDFIIQNKANFLFFNFLEHSGKVHNIFNNFLKQFKTIPLSTKSCAGQNRKGTSVVKEVLITNL